MLVLPENTQGANAPVSNPALESSCDVVVVPVVTVKETVVVWVMPPPVAVTVTELAPVVAVEAAVKVKVELPLPGAAILAGLKLAVTPAGRADVENEIALLNPPETEVETV